MNRTIEHHRETAAVGGSGVKIYKSRRARAHDQGCAWSKYWEGFECIQIQMQS
jgi:hypothetical protein